MPPAKKYQSRRDDDSPKDSGQDEPKAVEKMSTVGEAPACSGLNIQPGTGALCKTCFPDGWPKGATGIGCKHGSWTRTATGVVS